MVVKSCYIISIPVQFFHFELPQSMQMWTLQMADKCQALTEC